MPTRISVFALNIALFTVVAGCASSDDADDPVEESNDRLIENFIHVGGDGMWMTFPVQRTRIESLLPPEIELADRAVTVPVFVFVLRLDVKAIGPLPTTALTPDWNESIFLIPRVRFRAPSSCERSRSEEFNFVSVNYLTNKVVAAGFRFLWSTNRYYGDISFGLDGYRADVRLAGEDSLHLETEQVAGAASSAPELFKLTWKLPALAPGASDVFVRYDPEWTINAFHPANGHVEIGEGYRGLPSGKITLQTGSDAFAARVNTDMSLRNFTQCR